MVHKCISFFIPTEGCPLRSALNCPPNFSAVQFYTKIHALSVTLETTFPCSGFFCVSKFIRTSFQNTEGVTRTRVNSFDQNRAYEPLLAVPAKPPTRCQNIYVPGSTSRDDDAVETLRPQVLAGKWLFCWKWFFQVDIYVWKRGLGYLLALN